jgi:hypothetical protein
MNSDNKKHDVPEHDRFFARLGIVTIVWGVAVAVAVLAKAVLR